MGADLAGAIPPPFKPYHTYYIVPRSFKKDLEALAMGDDEITAASPTDLQLDLTELLESVEGQEVITISTREDDDGNRFPTPLGTKGSYFTIKDGLSEDEDFLFVHEKGWKKIIEW
jgi:hypothetical protein